MTSVRRVCLTPHVSQGVEDCIIKSMITFKSKKL